MPKPDRCPECGSEALTPTGPFRTHCNGCDSLLKNEDIIKGDPSDDTTEEQA